MTDNMYQIGDKVEVPSKQNNYKLTLDPEAINLGIIMDVMTFNTELWNGTYYLTYDTTRPNTAHILYEDQVKLIA